MNDEKFQQAMYDDFDKFKNGECSSTKQAIMFYAIFIPIFVAIIIQGS